MTLSFTLSVRRILTTATTIAACAASAACVSITRVPPPASPGPAPTSAPASTTAPTPAAPSPTASAPAIPAVRSGSWQFTFAPGNYSYSVVTDARIMPMPGPTQGFPAQGSPTQALTPPELVQRATITISPSGEVQVTDPTTTTASACDPGAALVTRMQSLIPRLPARLVAGDTWTDSTTTSGCRGSVPATSHVTRSYTVIGDTTFAGMPAVQLHRTDAITASGEGSEGQHRVLIAAAGTGGGDLFFDSTGGRFLGATGTQHTTVDVTTSGRTSRFVQDVTDRVTLTP